MAEYTILEQVKLKLRQFHTDSEIDADGNKVAKVVFDASDDDFIINQLISEAKKDVAAYRNYPATYSAEKIEKDLEGHSNIIVKLVMFDFVKEGTEFQKSYNVNETSAEYVDRDSILSSVVPFVHII